MAAVILLAIIAIQAGVIVYLYRSRRKECSIYIDLAAAHIRLVLDHKRDIEAWREIANRERRNTGKAEM
jgi:hypothetical protein